MATLRVGKTMFLAGLGALLILELSSRVLAASDPVILEPGKAFVLDATKAEESILRQCSRPAPEAVNEFWHPAEKDIQALETALTSYLAGAKSLPSPGVYHRQYTGYKKAGIRYIYGNFYRGNAYSSDIEAISPVMVCDGGPNFWGIIYNVDAARIENVDFNGRV